MSWISDALADWLAAEAGEGVSRARRPWIVGAAAVAAILAIALLLRFALA